MAIALSRAMQIRFEQGMIVLELSRRLRRLGPLPGMRWDASKTILRGPAHFYPGVRSELVERGLPFDDRIRAQRRAGPASNAPHARQLDAYQEESLRSWERSGRKGVLVLPTRAGARDVALAAISRMLRPTLVLTASCDHADEWVEVLRASTFEDVSRLSSPPRRHALQISTFHTAARLLASQGHRFELLVIDDALSLGVGPRHRDAGRRALSQCTAGARLGFARRHPSGSRRPLIEQLIGPAIDPVHLRW